MATTRRPGQDHHRARPGHDPQLRDCFARVLAGLWAVALLLLTAIDALVTAVLGVPPVGPVVRRWVVVLVEEYRGGRAGVVEAEVIDTDREVWL